MTWPSSVFIGEIPQRCLPQWPAVWGRRLIYLIPMKALTRWILRASMPGTEWSLVTLHWTQSELLLARKTSVTSRDISRIRRHQMPNDLKFALVHIDCDLYTPIVNALNYFYPRLMPGGYLIIHDYFSLAWDGAEKAVDEFFADKFEPVIPLTDGCGSAVIRKAREPVPGNGSVDAEEMRAVFGSVD